MIVRSKQALTYEALEGKSGIISPKIKSIEKDFITGAYYIKVIDRLQILREDPLPGEPLYSYIDLRIRSKTYGLQEINNLYTMFGQLIDPQDNDFDHKTWSNSPEMLLFISNTTSIYSSEKKSPSDIISGIPGSFEMVDETLEIQPEP